jgi:hypothetical protein
MKVRDLPQTERDRLQPAWCRRNSGCTLRYKPSARAFARTIII